MSVFAYRGRTAAGIITGEVEADDRMSVVAQLRAKGVVATSVQEKKPRAGAAILLRARGRRAKDKHLAIYTRQFSTMI
jgi:type II secretory pathway component PulF